MIISIASNRGPKVEAVKKVVGSIRHYLKNALSEIDYQTYDVDAGIIMPRTLEELMNGAQNRVKLLREMLKSNNQHSDFSVGMEGGFHLIKHNGNDLVFLQSWAYVDDGHVGYFGSSGNVLVPERIAVEVMEKDRDLSEVIDEVTQTSDIRSKRGTWGVLTRDFLTRQQSFEIALTAAFTPFYNKEIYK
jgi:non-canonical (house-cleaning) NTP pyrophosphatase